MVRREQEPVADPQRTGFNSPRENTSVVRSVNILDGKTERLLAGGFDGFQGVDCLEQRSSLKPWRRAILGDNIRPVGRRNRDERASGQAAALQKVAVFPFDLPKR